MLVTFWLLKGLRKVLPLMEEMLMADVRVAHAAKSVATMHEVFISVVLVPPSRI